MQSLRLITFDIFGTLLDWHAYVEQAFPGQYETFLAASAARQTPERARFPYRELLLEVGGEVGPGASREALEFFADGIGFAKEFSDSRSVQMLSSMAMLGVVSNCDVRHLLDAQRTLGLAFDVALTAEDCRAYKPHHEAWDAAVETVTRKMGFDRRSWLHVSAYSDCDLVPAKERGIKTCFIPRPGGTDPATALRHSPDFTVTDLWQLSDLVAEINGVPVRYSVKAAATSAAVAKDFIHWMRYEHGPALLQVRSCQQYQVVQLSPTEVVCDYVFTNRAALDEFRAGAAAELEQQVSQRFAPTDLHFERTDGILSAGSRHRTRLDFHAPRRP